MQELIFEDLPLDGKKLLLSAFDYSVDDDGYIIDNLLGEKVSSLGKPIKVEEATFTNGSLKIMDSDPVTISRFLREKIEK